MNDSSHIEMEYRLVAEQHSCGQDKQQASVDLLEEARATTVAALFRTMGDMNRIRIISLLRQHELCVHDIAELLEMSQSAVSHQMRALRQMRLVRHRKAGRHVYYTLDDEHVQQLFEIGLAHAEDG